jgi:hypothetical protein
MPPDSGRAQEVADRLHKASHNNLEAARQLLASPCPLTGCFRKNGSRFAIFSSKMAKQLP